MSDRSSELQLRSGKRISKPSFCTTRGRRRLNKSRTMVLRSPIDRRSSGFNVNSGAQSSTTEENAARTTTAVASDNTYFEGFTQDSQTASSTPNTLRFNQPAEDQFVTKEDMKELLLSVDQKINNTMNEFRKMMSECLSSLASNQPSGEDSASLPRGTAPFSAISASQVPMASNSCHAIPSSSYHLPNGPSSTEHPARTTAPAASMPSQTNTGPGISIPNTQRENATFNQHHATSVFATTKHLQFWSFYKHDPQGWFKQLEDLFLAHNVNDDEAKFNFVDRHLTQDIHHDLQYKLHTLVRGQKYQEIKRILTDRYAETPQQQLDRLFKGLEIGPKKPSDFLAEMMSLAQDQVPRETIISIWKKRLPPQIQTMIWNYKQEEELIKTADLAYELLNQPNHINVLRTENQPSTSTDEILHKILAAVQRPYINNSPPRRQSRFKNSQYRSRANSQIRRSRRDATPARSSTTTKQDNQKNRCWFHQKFGKEARNCQLPCDWVRGPGQDYQIKNSEPQEEN